MGAPLASVNRVRTGEKRQSVNCLPGVDGWVRAQTNSRSRKVNEARRCEVAPLSMVVSSVICASIAICRVCISPCRMCISVMTLVCMQEFSRMHADRHACGCRISCSRTHSRMCSRARAHTHRRMHAHATASHRMAPHGTTPCGTALHGTARHRIAQHCANARGLRTCVSRSSHTTMSNGRSTFLYSSGSNRNASK